MIIIPNIFITLVLSPLDENSQSLYLIKSVTGLSDYEVFALVGLLLIMFGVWFLWGVACVFTVGKRIIKSPAGRSRSSFAVVRQQGKKLIIPLLLTTLLRDCFTLFWSLLLIIPGIIYSIRTSFYEVIIACEGKEYREALKYSQKIVKGHTWQVFLYMLGISLIIFIPVIFITIGIEVIALTTLSGALVLASIILQGAVHSFASVLLFLSIIILYKEVKALK